MKVNRHRTERLCIGLTPEEKDYITSAAQAAGISKTEYIINSVRGTKIIIATGLPNVLIELIRQRNNLNQLIYHGNVMKRVSHESVQETCRACQGAYEQLVLFVINGM